MTLKEVEALKMEDYRISMMYRILKDEIKALPSNEFWLLSDNPIIIHENLSIPEEEMIISEFNLYKEELREDIRNKIKEDNRIKGLEEDIECIIEDHNKHLYIHTVLLDTPNPVKYLKDMIKDSSKDDEIRTIIKSILIAKEEYYSSLTDDTISDVERMKLDRCKFLLETDFTQLADAPFTSAEKALYREYRQYLRDLPMIYKNAQILEPIAMNFDDWMLNKPIYKKY